MNTVNKLRKIIIEFIIITLYFGISIFTASIFYNHVTSNNIYLYTLSNIFCDLILLIVFLFIFRKIIVPNFYDFKKNWKEYLNQGIIPYIIGFFIMNTSVLIIESFIGGPVNEELNQSYLELYPIYSIFSMLIIAPVVEELMTRALLKDTFKHPIIYILFTGFIFGFLHTLSIFTTHDFKELFYIIPYGALGCSLAYMYYKTNNIWTNISFHFFHNFVCVLLFLRSLI